jgi:hypothetical protein
MKKKSTKTVKAVKAVKQRRYQPRKPRGPASSDSGPLPRELLMSNEDIRESHENGCSMRSIAIRAGCHHVTIANRLRAMGAI